MKKLILSLAIVAMAVPATFGQIVRSTTFTKQEAPKIEKAPKADYDIIGFSYSLQTFSFKVDPGKDPDPISANGVSIKYLHGFSVSQNLPMFVEFGANLQSGFGSEEVSDNVFRKSEFINVAIPLNFAYRVQLANKIYVKPYIGLNFKVNILGRAHSVYEYDGEKEESDWLSYYDEDDTGEDMAWKRFQLGWHIGADIQFNKFYIGLNYGTDFIKALNYDKNDYEYKVNTSTFNVGLGFYF